MPGSVLGLMGGGQLGRMFAQAAARMGYEVVVLEKGQCPASEVSAMHIDAGYTEAEALKALKGPLSNVPNFRKKLQDLVNDEKTRDALLQELGIDAEEDK